MGNHQEDVPLNQRQSKSKSKSQSKSAFPFLASRLLQFD